MAAPMLAQPSFCFLCIFIITYFTFFNDVTTPSLLTHRII